MAEVISHPGRIVEVTPEYTTVQFTALSACSACHAKALCEAGAEGEERVIQIPTTPGPWEAGQEIEVCLKRGMGFKAVWLCYVIPLLVLLAVLLGLFFAGVQEWIAGLAAVGATLLYYLVLALFKERLSNEYTFYIKDKK